MEVRIVESDLLVFPKENWRWLRFRSNYRKIRIIEVRIRESLLYIIFIIIQYLFVRFFFLIDYLQYLQL